MYNALADHISLKLVGVGSLEHRKQGHRIWNFVTLYPKETCSCPTTTECYHIMAAKMAIGKQEDVKRKTL